MFDISACAWCLKTPASISLPRLRDAGFDFVDLRPDCWDGIRDEQHLRSFGLRIRCAGITPIEMAQGVSLESLATADAGRALPYFVGALRRAAGLGAKWAYMVTPKTRSGTSPEYVRSMVRLADEAGALGIRMCIEPHPGRALSNYSEVMALLDAAKSPNLFALLDLGHIPLAGEQIEQTVRMLGDRIGYVHIDDNDGRSDSHFGLLEGQLGPKDVYGFLSALAGVGYRGPVAIELSSSLPSPVSSLVASRDFIAAWALSRPGV